MGICAICGKKTGMLSAGYVNFKDGVICTECYKNAGYSAFDFKTLLEMQEMPVSEFIRRIEESNEDHDWDDAEYVLDKVRETVVHPNIALKDGELCFFHAQGAIGKKKTKKTSYTQKSRSYKTITGKRITYGTRTNEGSETYYEKTPCDFYMTSDRFIATVPQGRGFIIKYNKVLGIKMHKDAIEINNDGNAVIVFMSSYLTKKFMNTWDLLGKMAALGLSFEDLSRQKKTERVNTADEILDELIIDTVVISDETDLEEEQNFRKTVVKDVSEKTPEENSNTGQRPQKEFEIDPVTEIRKYKSLLDDGIITQEEFEKKKKQLLGI